MNQNYDVYTKINKFLNKTVVTYDFNLIKHIEKVLQNEDVTEMDKEFFATCFDTISKIVLNYGIIMDQTVNDYVQSFPKVKNKVIGLTMLKIGLKSHNVNTFVIMIGNALIYL